MSDPDGEGPGQFHFMIQRRIKPRAQAIWTQMPGAVVSEKIPRRRLAAISERMRLKLSRYFRARQLFLLTHPTCAVDPERKSVEAHHMRGRLGELLLDQRFWLPVSAEGHRWIHEHPAAARQNGWLCAAGEWNVKP